MAMSDSGEFLVTYEPDEKKKERVPLSGTTKRLILVMGSFFMVFLVTFVYMMARSAGERDTTLTPTTADGLAQRELLLAEDRRREAALEALEDKVLSEYRPPSKEELDRWVDEVLEKRETPGTGDDRSLADSIFKEEDAATREDNYESLRAGLDDIIKRSEELEDSTGRVPPPIYPDKREISPTSPSRPGRVSMSTSPAISRYHPIN
jgi:hypothetical protein